MSRLYFTSFGSKQRTLNPDLQRFILILLLCLPLALFSQHPIKRHFLEPADTLDKTRFWVSVGGATALYGTASIGLYEAWYKGFELTSFHSFDDWQEWRKMDKAGHLFTTNLESRLVFQGARWTGMNRRSAMWTGAGVGMLLQTTIEVMDGFSSEWGFSWSDMGFNALGAGMFVAQEMAWQDQRIIMKASYTEPQYADFPILGSDGISSTTLRERANSLYGISFAERFLKGYNGLTVWASSNPSSFFPKEKRPDWLPAWLNVAVGYGAENMFGGTENRWDENGVEYRIDEAILPRYSQYYLSLDVDFTRIKTKSRLLKTLFHTINWIKVPAPAVELTSRGRLRFHPVMW